MFVRVVTSTLYNASEGEYFKLGIPTVRNWHNIIFLPPSTGKTTLIRQIVTKNKNFFPLFIDGRAGQFDTPANVYNSIKSEFKSFITAHRDFLERILGSKFKMSYSHLETEFNFSNTKEISSINVRSLLNDIKNCLQQ
ncbi:hypothetical protein GLOIN_2v1768409 [Rhizophagus irregularis DAOM 181602=DAOM 197198]|uniref:Uncharacterized protein n=1 Tax=Rhizophagus irregularis (strain DAOM 181602 / DAOM 197198 / MUCL 43194) TaxID=747089 RepID=A0A2P4QH29_RHIID|nr:hypothetical protein GLOIN_2v1768409 [Rhizophagus irregularis DAOM 181602=DAOM 197198]POG76945.1 hypothetical protein GLOIN_2v1768409 [Rhizophagus irregularis DAOM 181602=DAOM 197198]CAG8482777.1 23174_t:CDS:2 [Rhizophagus irregularis]|eukprot:XP_025183811.1 hypothetical protein GLOIN_2v1768409 [Rhizophagus irregularis DAOM 181602=DAOM 197198]